MKISHDGFYVVQLSISGLKLVFFSFPSVACSLLAVGLLIAGTFRCELQGRYLAIKVI